MDSSREKFVDSIKELDGKSDTNIQDYFYENKSFRTIRDAKDLGVVIGLKGSGKSSLLARIAPSSTIDAKTIAIRFSPDEVQAFAHQGEQVSPLQFANSVKLGLAAFLVREIEEKGLLAKLGADQHKEEDIRAKIDLLGEEVIARMKALEGVSLLSLGLKWKLPGAKGKLFQPLSAKDSAGIYDVIDAALAAGITIRVVTDDIDRIFSSGAISDPVLIGGFLLGARDLGRSHKSVRITNIVKSNVYKSA